MDENTIFDAAQADALMVVCLDSHFKVFGKLTPLMALFASRACSEHPDWINPAKLPKEIRDSLLIDEAARGSRKQCFERFLPTLREFGAHV